ncbi:hypothetical protein XELAEV_18034438mg [Xenopus laevis]|uniref:Uncharacterized protein n=1 Tax=Xenopus laevis TaxID=8355 RepID=A0A974CE66_XENLA|nr:hypothetical protein XELAEV_18034438mg [Xenopus laevis]
MTVCRRNICLDLGQKWVTHAASRPSHPCYFKLNIYLSPNIELRCYVRGIWELARLWLACCRYMYEGYRLMVASVCAQKPLCCK